MAQTKTVTYEVIMLNDNETKIERRRKTYRRTKTIGITRKQDGWTDSIRSSWCIQTNKKDQIKN